MSVHAQEALDACRGAGTLDSSVRIGLTDARDAMHRPAVEALRRRRESDLVAPASAFAEITVGALQLGDRTARRVDAIVDDLASDIRPTDPRQRGGSRGSRPRSGIRLPDALILATGRVLEAEVLARDRRWAGEPGRITVLEA
ncbi:type II toxin-antitoxin system VapC family toxin [Glycomyces tarimensis]